MSQQITDWDYQRRCLLGQNGVPFEYGGDVTCCTDPCQCAYKECVYYGVGDPSDACGWYGDNCIPAGTSGPGSGGGSGGAGDPRRHPGPAAQ